MHDATATLAFTDAQQQTLLQLARAAVESGLRTGRPMPIDPADHDPALAQTRAAFVTLHVGGELHGCIGTIEPARPLVAEVARCAFGAAFEDPRFEPIAREDLPFLDIHISVLTPPQPLHADDEADLIRQLRPGIDGVVLEDEALGRRGTFLPAVWDKLPDPRDFVTQLKIKAGLPPDHWSPTLQWYRYTAQSIG